MDTSIGSPLRTAATSRRVLGDVVQWLAAGGLLLAFVFLI